MDVKVTVFFFLCFVFFSVFFFFFASFFKCLNGTTALTCTLLANNYPSSNEISEKNGMVQGGCIACDALFKVATVLPMVKTLNTNRYKKRFNPRNW